MEFRAIGAIQVQSVHVSDFSCVKNLGARQAFDYRDAAVVANIVRALDGKTLAGALAVGKTSANACIDIVRRSEGKKFVAMATFPISFENGGGVFAILAVMWQYIWFTFMMAIRSRIGGVRTKFIFGGSLINNEVSKVIYVDFLPEALAERRYQPAPLPQVVGTGHNLLQQALDRQRLGVSASKVVVSLEVG